MLDADLKLFVTSVLQEEPWKYDSKVIPMPWRQGEEDAISSKIQSGGLTLGFYNCDGNVSSGVSGRQKHTDRRKGSPTSSNTSRS
jgi:hypothetical protein